MELVHDEDEYKIFTKLTQAEELITTLFQWFQIAAREEDQDEDEKETTPAHQKPSGMRLKVPGSRA